MSKASSTIESVHLGKLSPYSKNPRTHSPSNVDKLAASLTEYGWTSPVLISDSNEIIAGHGRVLAAQKLGFLEAPCIRLSHLTSDQVKAYRLADNRLALDSDWDMDLLKLELGDLDLDAALTGFDPHQINQILNANASQKGEDDTPTLQETAVSQPGEIWALGPHRLLCGDATDAIAVARLLSEVTPSVMVTDPPYGVEYNPAWRKVLPFGVKRARFSTTLAKAKPFTIPSWVLALRLSPRKQSAASVTGLRLIRSTSIWPSDAGKPLPAKGLLGLEMVRNLNLKWLDH